jgi:hypothetical protein
MSKLVEIGVENIADSTEYIEMDDGTIVNNKEHIMEFYKNSNANIMKSIQDELAKLNEVTQIKPQKVVCSSCTQEYEVPLEFDYANFFANGS